MHAICPRYALPVLLLAGVALIPTVLHSYVGARVQDNRRVSVIPPTLAEMSSRPTARKAAWVTRVLESDDWIERTYSAPGRELMLFAGRSYDPKRLYHHPELALIQAPDFRPVRIERLGSDRIPVYVFEPNEDHGTKLAVYTLHYRDGFVDNPVRFQLRSSLDLLVSGRRPMTLFFVHDPASPRGVPLEAQPAVRLLLGAVQSFERPAPRL